MSYNSSEPCQLAELLSKPSPIAKGYVIYMGYLLSILCDVLHIQERADEFRRTITIIRSRSNPTSLEYTPLRNMPKMPGRVAGSQMSLSVLATWAARLRVGRVKGPSCPFTVMLTGRKGPTFN